MKAAGSTNGKGSSATAMAAVSTEKLIREAATRVDFADAVRKLGGHALVFDAKPAEWHVALPITGAAAARTPTAG